MAGSSGLWRRVIKSKCQIVGKLENLYCLRVRTLNNAGDIYIR